MPIIGTQLEKKYFAAKIIRKGGGTPGTFDPDVQAWIDAIEGAGGTLSSGEKNAVNDYWIAMKGFGLDTEALADWPLVGDKIAQSFNLKDPTKFRITWVATNASDHTSQGWQQSGSAYGDTGLNPNTVFADNNTGSYESYSRTNVDGALVDMGNRVSGSSRVQIEGRNDGQARAFLHDGNAAAGAVPDSLGQFCGVRSASGSTIYRNGTLLTTNGAAGGNRPNGNIALGCYIIAGNPAAFTGRQYAGFGVYFTLTEPQALNFYTARQAMNVALGRSVGAAGDTFVAYNTNVQRTGATLTTDEGVGTLDFLKALEAADLLDQFEAFFPILGGTALAHGVSLFNNAQYKMTFNGGWTHSATGALGNGTDTYGETNLNAARNLKTWSSASLGAYVRQTPVDGLIGAEETGVGDFSLVVETGPARFDFDAFEALVGGFTQGSVLGARENSSRIRVVAAGTVLASGDIATQARPDFPIYVGAVNKDGSPSMISTNEFCTWFISDSAFTETETVALSNAIDALQSKLGR